MAAGIVMSLAIAWTTTPPRAFTIFIGSNTGIGATVISAVQVAIVLSFWSRRRWSRWAVFFLSLLWLVHMLLWLLPWGNLQTAWRQDWSYVVLMIAKFFLALYLLSCLNSSDVRAWFNRSLAATDSPKA
jgi:hypothetical protein